jgi:hypothetical protein
MAHQPTEQVVVVGEITTQLSKDREALAVLEVAVMQARTTSTTAHPVQLIQAVAVAVLTCSMHLLRLVALVLLFFVTLAHRKAQAVL